jgi:parallel beta-helix repeat protein
MMLRHDPLRRAVPLLLALGALLSGCGAGSAGPSEPAPPPIELPAGTAPAGEDGGVTPATPCVRPAAQADAAPAAEGAAPSARFDGSTNTIILSAGAGVSLGALSQALDRPEALRELAPGEWLLGANLQIEPGAALRVAAPEVRWLKLRSDEEQFVALRALGGELTIAGACVTSWDAGRSAADENYDDGRSFVLARDGAQLTVEGAELRYLGYDADESFGLAWRTAGTGGALLDSAVSHNYYGVYSYEVDDLLIRGNEVHHNVLYGIDPHTRSLRLRIEGNEVHDNGKHGIILAEGCADGVVSGNRVYNNLHHGIVVYNGSDRALVEGNSSFGNGGQGININNSAGGMVRENLVYENLGAGIGVGQGAADNQLEANKVRANGEDGVVLFSAATGTTVRANTIADNLRYGIYIKTAGEAQVLGNSIVGNRVGVYLLDAVAQVDPAANSIAGNHEGPIQSSPPR